MPERDRFMRRYFGMLPSDLQAMIMLHIPDWRLPRPRFRVGQPVRLAEEPRNRLQRYALGLRYCVGPMPTGTLHVLGRTWCRRSAAWRYDFGYGLLMQCVGSTMEDGLQDVGQAPLSASAPPPHART